MPIDDANWQLLVPQLSVLQLDEDEFLHQAGDTNTFIAFITKGSMRAFFTDDQLVETNLLLCGKNEFISDYESFITQTPAKYAIQAIEKCELILLPKKALDTLYESSFYWNKFGRIVAEGIYLNSKKRAEELLFNTPEKRYLNLMKQHPEYFQKYALKHLAGYLGIAPQSLSRIRARLTQH